MQHNQTQESSSPVKLNYNQNVAGPEQQGQADPEGSESSSDDIFGIKVDDDSLYDREKEKKDKNKVSEAEENMILLGLRAPSAVQGS